MVVVVNSAGNILRAVIPLAQAVVKQSIMRAFLP